MAGAASLNKPGHDFARRFREADCIFFDCDGVILDSNRMKLDVLEQVLQAYPPPVRAPMVSYWTQSGGLSRHVKFRHFARALLQAADAEAAATEAIARFAELTRASYGRCAPLPDALALMREAGRARCHVVSGTDQQELRDVFQDKGLSALCADVLGSPIDKATHIADVLRRHGDDPRRALFVGDGGGDFAACRATGVHFVYVAQMSEWTQAREILRQASNVTWADSLRDLCDALSQ